MTIQLQRLSRLRAYNEPPRPTLWLRCSLDTKTFRSPTYSSSSINIARDSTSLPHASNQMTAATTAPPRPVAPSFTGNRDTVGLLQEHSSRATKLKCRLQKRRLGPCSAAFQTARNWAAQTNFEIGIRTRRPVILLDLRHAPATIKHSKQFVL